MAQSCYFVTVDGELYEEVLVHKPDRMISSVSAWTWALTVHMRLTPWM